MRHKHIILAGVLAGMVAPSAFGYLDPGTGSMLLQVVLGGVAAIAVAARLYWHRFKHLLGIGRKPQDKE